MVNLDFLTLYIVIFLNSLTVSVVWGAFAWRYRPHPAAQYWLAACLLSLAGGGVLAIQGNEGALWPAVIGNTIIVFGFCQFWIGLRRFHGEAGGQAVALGITLLAASLMIVLHDQDRGRSIVYAAGQATVLALCATYLLKRRPLSLGAVIAACAFIVAVGGQLLVVAGNIGVLSGALEFATFYRLASYALLCTIFSGSVWNLGFAILTIDKLQRDLGRLSETDDLTGLANRRALRVRMEREHASSKASGQPYSVIVIDLDYFKQLNDTFGHAAGDQALVAFAGILRTCVRRTDVVARMGGDEFCILLPATAKEEATVVADMIRSQLGKHPVKLGGQDIRLSASIGVSDWRPGTELGNDEIVAAADRHLYREKADSREDRQRPRKGLYLVS